MQPSIQQLIEQLGDSDKPKQNEAVNALVGLGAAAVDPLIDALGHASSTVRMNAVQALGKIGDARAVPILCNLIDGPDKTALSPAIYALAALGAIDEVKSLLQGDRTDACYWSLRALDDAGRRDECLALAAQLFRTGTKPQSEAAERYLGYVSDPRTLDVFVAMLDSADENTVRFGLFHLRKLKDQRSMDGLIKALKHQNSEIRGFAAQVLGEFADDRAIDPLKTLLKDRDLGMQTDYGGGSSSTVAQTASGAISQIKSRGKSRRKLW